MSEFVDRLLLQLSQPQNLLDLLAPASDPTHERIHLLLGWVFDLEFATLHDIRDVQIRQLEFQRPVFTAERTRGNWTQTVPSYARTDLYLDTHAEHGPLWIDLAADISLTLVLEIDQGRVQSILTRRLNDFNTLDEFRNQFRYIDVDAFMATHEITSVTELKERFHYLKTDIQLQPLPVFDPADPANQHHYTLQVAVFVHDELDVAGALRAAKFAQLVAKRTAGEHSGTEATSTRTPYAPILIFPRDSLSSEPFTETTVQSFFAAQQMLALFVAPT